MAQPNRQRSLPGLPPAEISDLCAFDLRVTFDQVRGFSEFVWSESKAKERVAVGQIRCTGAEELTWEMETEGRRGPAVSSHHRNSIRAALGRWLKRFPIRADTFSACWIRTQPGNSQPICEPEAPFAPEESISRWLEETIEAMALALRLQFLPVGRM